ncbi:hypothetical protein BLNAU_25283 [Blattamonas nauphoetae]|uniref:Uncharacterized protein n=1 Tax=Blattamonas nauphoetae TaxID=2049346 RepID=A0ABQ9WM00_9EUKA|nr:hypothetical protein BLNAU_25283 [Blattamonas nauphoetae]
MHNWPITVQDCSFADWYPSNDANTYQTGGGLGTHITSAQLQITNTNFTLSGDTSNKNNGGSFSSGSSSIGQSTTITNCRFIGDTKTTGIVLNIYPGARRTSFISVTDSQIIGTNSKLSVDYVTFVSMSGFTRTEITNTSIEYDHPSSPTHPHLFVDCKLTQCSLYFENSYSLVQLFTGTTLTGKLFINSSKALIKLDSVKHAVFHQCDFTDCSPSSKHFSFYSYTTSSLIVDTCSFTRCSGGKSLFDVSNTFAFFYFCSFTNVSGTSACVVTSDTTYASFFEACRFDLEESNVLDFVVSSSDLTYLNDTTMIGCTSNRKMYFGTTWANRTELKPVQAVPVEAEKNEMRVGTWLPESEEDTQQQIPTFSSLSEALAALPTPPKDTVITFSDGDFAENALLEVSHIVDIVGAGSNVIDSHSTQLKTNGLFSKSTGKLTLRSLRLIPSTSSSFIASTSDSGSVILLNVIVEDISEHSACLFQFSAGSSEIRHSFFKNIESSESLICVSGTSSLVITNTLIVTIKRSSPKPNPVKDVQCASCIEGKTSGTVKVIYCRFGVCSTNGRAGAIDLEKNDENSAVEMSYCYFDQNSGGTDVADAVRGYNVVLNSFDDSKTVLDLLTIQSFPSLFSFLINSDHPIVPPPARLYIIESGSDDPLTWSSQLGQLSKSFLETYPLQYLLGSRLWNNTNTEITIPLWLYYTAIKLTIPTLTSPFIRLVRAEKDAELYYTDTTPLLTSPLTAPFIVCMGAKRFKLENLKLNFTFVHSASFASAKDSTVSLGSNQIQLLSTYDV